MGTSPDLIVVFRSTDDDAAADAAVIRARLAEAGLTPTLREEEESGSFEVLVPAGEADDAIHLLSIEQPDVTAAAAEEVDPSADLDMVTLYEGEMAIAEMEAMHIKGVLNANNIPAFLVGAASMPNLAFQVKVPREQLDAARQVLDEARAAGPEAAAEAQALGDGERPA
ncbi:MAG: DUF2007 domain-containing protein [Bryobacteraceae bacterium]|nr:DUF2007 domain-containing protein [Bryobacteraceae bacterium]